MGEMADLNTLGILGGTFDPIHLGHIQMATEFVSRSGIGRVLFIPDGNPPHKQAVAGKYDRLEMTRLAVEDYPGFEACDVEINRTGPTYTVDTLIDLKKQSPDDEFIYIVGSDTLMVIDKWKRFDEVASLLKSVAVIPRADDDMDAILRKRDEISREFNIVIDILDCRVKPVSSSEIRYRVARHLPLDEMAPKMVIRYIKAKNLYGDDAISSLKRSMTPARFKHTLGVEKTAVEMAKIFGCDQEKARRAALYHDCAKHMNVGDMEKLVDEYGIQTSPGDRESRALLHAAAGMALAQKEFGETDPDVLNAIRWHTTGKANMTTLEKIIYLADMIEPERRPFPGIEQIRELAKTDLDKAMALAAQRTVDYVKMRAMPLNEKTLELLKSISLKKCKEDE